jgi:hypothetical protein
LGTNDGVAYHNSSKIEWLDKINGSVSLVKDGRESFVAVSGIKVHRVKKKKKNEEIERKISFILQKKFLFLESFSRK